MTIYKLNHYRKPQFTCNDRIGAMLVITFLFGRAKHLQQLCPMRSGMPYS